MVGRKISADMKRRALILLEEGWEMEDITDALGVSSRSITRWGNNYQEHGRVDPPSALRGRPRKLNAEVLLGLKDLIHETPSLFLDEIGDWLAIYHDQPISTTALHDNLRDIGLHLKVLKRTASQRDEVARAAWQAETLATYAPSQLVFTDESSKDGRTLVRLYGRAPAGERPVESVPHRRGKRWSIIPALTVNGYIALRAISGSVNSEDFFDFILNDVLPKMGRFPQPNSVLVMDNASIHKSNALRQVVEGAGCRLVFLPPYSPDFNPIEESFNVVKAALRRNWRRLENSENPLDDLLEVCMAAVTPENALAWYKDCGY